MQISSEQFQTLLPLACLWAEEQEKLIAQKGVCLTLSQIEDAEKVGISHPNDVRLLKVDKIPLPKNPELLAAIKLTQILSPGAHVVTFRYGIYIRSEFWGNRPLVVHELVHTAQYERMGGFKPFLEKYLLECFTIGYPDGPMEQEAIRISKEMCSSK
jgi:hypothetical protein